MYIRHAVCPILGKIRWSNGTLVQHNFSSLIVVIFFLINFEPTGFDIKYVPANKLLFQQIKMNVALVHCVTRSLPVWIILLMLHAHVLLDILEMAYHVKVFWMICILFNQYNVRKDLITLVRFVSSNWTRKQCCKISYEYRKAEINDYITYMLSVIESPTIKRTRYGKTKVLKFKATISFLCL